MSFKKNHTEKEFRRWQKVMKICRKIFRCHQLPERSFFYRGMQFPVCARCTGIIIGFFIVGPIITIFTFGNMFLSIIFILLMVMDGLLQYNGVRESNNYIRVITGLLFGYGIFSIAMHIVVKLIEIINIII